MVPSVQKNGFFSIGGNRKGKGEKERKERKKERRKGRKKKKKKGKRKEKKKKKEKKRREKKEKKKKEEKRREERRERKIRKKVKRFGKEGTKKLGIPRIREDTRVERFFLTKAPLILALHVANYARCPRQKTRTTRPAPPLPTVHLN